MEDILASIRRIIADDQANGSRSGAARRSQAATASNHGNPPATRTAEAFSKPSEDSVLDLASFGPPSPDTPAAAVDSAEHHDETHEPADPEPEDHAIYRAPDLPPLGGERVGSFVEHEERGVSDAYAAADHGVESGRLLSAPMGNSVMSAFEALAATVILENKPMLERVLGDLLRPMLKAWLDDNLPGLVERLVRSEIERVARGGRP